MIRHQDTAPMIGDRVRLPQDDSAASGAEGVLIRNDHGHLVVVLDNGDHIANPPAALTVVAARTVPWTPEESVLALAAHVRAHNLRWPRGVDDLSASGLVRRPLHLNLHGFGASGFVEWAATLSTLSPVDVHVYEDTRVLLRASGRLDFGPWVEMSVIPNDLTGHVESSAQWTTLPELRELAASVTPSAVSA